MSMSRWSATSCGLLLAIGACVVEDDDAPGTFECGINGGRCDADTEVCIVGGDDSCSTCVPRPAACDDDESCDCVPAGTDATWGSYQCVDAGSCSEQSGGGLVLTCTTIEWGCG
jgi:hypothetical protein